MYATFKRANILGSIILPDKNTRIDEDVFKDLRYKYENLRRPWISDLLSLQTLHHFKFVQVSLNDISSYA